MEYLARIICEQKTTNKNVWEYTFVDAQTNKEVCFYNNYRIDYNPNSIGKLKLIESDKHPKFFGDFERDVSEVSREVWETENSIQLKRELEKDIEKIDKKFAKRKIKQVERAKHLTSLRLQKIFSQKELAIAYQKSTRTIRRWEKKEFLYQKTGRKRGITSYSEDLLRNHVYTYPIATQQERADYLFQKTGQRHSQQIISLNLKRLSLPRKVVPYRYSQQKALMPKYWEFVNEIIPNLPWDRLLSLDESGFSTNLALRYGYAPIGKRVKAYKPGWGINYSLISLIHNTSKKGVIHWEVIEGAVNTEILYNYLVSVKLPTNEKYYLLMDNVRFHHSKKIKELLKQKNIEPVYLVPYFPQLNPTEEFFNTVKQDVRKHTPRDKEKLMSVLTETINELQEEEDMTKYFRDCLNFKIDKSGH